MKPSEFLTKERWTKGTFARDATDMPVPYMSDTAYKFCVAGTLYRLGLEFKEVRLLGELALLLFPERKIQVLVEFNDHPDTKWEDIQTLLKAANL